MSETDAVLCRSCLKKLVFSYEKIYLFDQIEGEKVSEFRTICDLFSKYVFLEVDKYDEITPYICIDCYELFMNFHRFRKMCVLSHFELLKQKYKISECYIPLEKCSNPSQHRNEEVSIKVEKVECAVDDFGSFSFDYEGGFSDTDSEEMPMLESEPIIKQEEETVIKKKRTKTKKSAPKIKQTKPMKTTDNNGDTVNKENEATKEQIKYACSKCEQTFSFLYLYERHMHEHNGSKAFSCEKCGKGFGRMKTLKDHLEKQHPVSGQKIAEYMCDVNGCGRTYACKVSLLKHIRVIHLKQEPQAGKVMCEICGQLMNSQGTLKNHMELHTQVKQTVQCHICSKTMSKRSLSAHIRYTHSHAGVKRYECNICGRVKFKRSEFLSHYNFHTRAKQYPCKICGKVFLLSNKLKNHIEVVHIGVKKYNCKYCDRKFGSAQTLRDHLMSHTGV